MGAAKTGWNEIDVTFGERLSAFRQPLNGPIDRLTLGSLGAQKGAFGNSSKPSSSEDK